MSNLIRYIIQEDPEKEVKKNNLDYTNQNNLKKTNIKAINLALKICWKIALII